MSKTKIIAARVPKPLIEKIMGFLAVRGYTCVSDYIRDLIRKDLENWEKAGQ